MTKGGIVLKHEVIALVLDNRRADAPKIQEILTGHGCIIQIRLGVHEIDGCSNQGLILLMVNGTEDEINNLVNELKTYQGVKVSSMQI
ncbi:MAG: hypothetical protein CVU87_06965 [Firmicutes bacterium HGW-Firmicutes-12]|jgi:metal-responsive CopG/Arc/MetJ family transcriptional regulator|nr:MAG: hypothetical protein CVU87_06965 [Firmicutes bacterium HGW-Firmicutes-12]